MNPSAKANMLIDDGKMVPEGFRVRNTHGEQGAILKIEE
jgi:hypothetical protein